MTRLAASMDVSHAGVSSALGSKRDVFLKSLDLYFANIDADLAGLIAGKTDAVGAVSAIVDCLLAAARKPAFTTIEWRGCLLGNTAFEFGTDDREVVDRLKAGVQVFRTHFKNALSLTSVDRRKCSENDIDRAALQLVAFVQGLLILARCGLSEHEIESVRASRHCERCPACKEVHAPTTS
jgi:TetR/AcrR family transcriptional repressor of nem operon